MMIASPGVKVAALLALGWFVLMLWTSTPGGGAPAAVAGVEALALLGFVAVHAATGVGWRGLLVFACLSLGVAFAMEACSIATGFPFGFFMHVAPGPKLFGVPPHVPPGYFVFGWIGYAIAALLVRRDPARARGIELVATPLVGAFVMTGYDLAYDPIGSAVLGMWRYRDPSGYFGVPLSNFLGWLFTGWLMLQLFALVEARFAAATAATREIGRAHV